MDVIKSSGDLEGLAASNEQWKVDASRVEEAVPRQDLIAMFEAARISTGFCSEQPSRFIVGVHGQSDDVRNRILACLPEDVRPVVQAAPVLVIGSYVTSFTACGKINVTAQHDLGVASAALAVEGKSRGYTVRAMRSILADEVREFFVLPHSVVPLTALAIFKANGRTRPSDVFFVCDESDVEAIPFDDMFLAGKP